MNTGASTKACATSDQALPGLPNELLYDILWLLDAYCVGLCEQVSAQWQTIANSPVLWQKQIQQYFPHVEQDQPADFQADPRALFVSELVPHVARVKDLPDYPAIKPFILEALSGNFDNIFNPGSHLPESAIKLLTLLAAANGHPHAILRRYFPFDPTDIPEATPNQRAFGQLVMASLRGELDTIDQAQIARRELHRAMTKKNLYILAAVCGHEDALSRLDEEGQFKALWMAAGISSSHIFAMILTKANVEFTINQKKRVLTFAMVSGQIHIVQTCFRQQFMELLAIEPVTLLHTALDSYPTPIFDYLWTQLHPQFTLDDKTHLLTLAAPSKDADPDHLLKLLRLLADEIQREPEYQYPTLFDLFFKALNRLSINHSAENRAVVNQLGLLVDNHTLVTMILLLIRRQHEQLLLSPDISRELKEKLLTALQAAKATLLEAGRTEGIAQINTAIAMCLNALFEREIDPVEALILPFTQLRLDEPEEYREDVPDDVAHHQPDQQAPRGFK